MLLLLLLLLLLLRCSQIECWCWRQAWEALAGIEAGAEVLLG